MKRLHILLCCIMAAVIHCSAQNATSKDFNKIKRSDEYFYYDVTMEQEEAAKNAAKINLAKLINDYIDSEGIKTGKITADDLHDVNYLQRDTYGMVRVLAYVKKSDYVDCRTAKEEVNKPAVATEKSEHSTIVEQDSTAAITIPTRNVPSPEAIALAKNEGSLSLTKWQQDAVAKLCKITDAEKFVHELIDLQNQYKVKRFGLQEDCKDEANSFFAIYDSNKMVVALLGLGTSSRYDFLSGGKESVDSYKAKEMKAIWFQLSK